MINAYVGDERDVTSEEAPIVGGRQGGLYTGGGARRPRAPAPAARARPGRPAGGGHRPQNFYRGAPQLFLLLGLLGGLGDFTRCHLLKCYALKKNKYTILVFFKVYEYRRVRIYMQVYPSMKTYALFYFRLRQSFVIIFNIFSSFVYQQCMYLPIHRYIAMSSY